MNFASPKWVTQAKKEYFCGMFVRKKKNRSGTTSVVVVDKSGKHFRELRTIGVSDKEKEIEALYQQGKKWLAHYLGERDVFAEHTREQEEKQVTDRLLGNREYTAQWDSTHLKPSFSNGWFRQNRR